MLTFCRMSSKIDGQCGGFVVFNELFRKDSEQAWPCRH
ncbi:hypothetical protein DA2_0913 [Desulfovibrio sp. A2]|nr:hypothetical protein DA2_0913 [Desulfovibrio sp. A2]